MITTLSMAELELKTIEELDALFLEAVNLLETTRAGSLQHHMALHLIENIVHVLFFKIKMIEVPLNHNPTI